VSLADRMRLVRDRSLMLGTVLERLAALHGTRRLVEEEADPDPLRLTFAQGADLVARQASVVAERIAPGDRVVIATPNGYGMLLLTMAVSRAGGIAVPVNSKMRPAEIEHVIADSGAACVIRGDDEIDPGNHPALPASASADPTNVAAILYTSGTTGRPKGVELTHRSLLGELGLATLWPGQLHRDEAVVGLPVAHVMGLAVLLALAAAGIPVYFIPRFRPDAALDAIEERRATVFVGVPAMYRMMLDAGAEDRDLRSVRLWASGADVMAADVAERFKRMGACVTLPAVRTSLGQATFAEAYGMVELGGGVAARLSPPHLPARFGRLLAPLPGFRMRVVDDTGGAARRGAVGHLLVKGPGVLRGYHGDAKATGEILSDDGWLRTGDLARSGPLGTVIFAGRDKDVIKHGGYSVYAMELERAMEEHPAVAEAAALGLPDERKGEVPAVVVRLRPGAAATEDELLTFGRSRLADYKAPQRVAVVADLPRTGTEKVKKPDLRALF
jgi:acyl-CoA synthetase (AMP-forming)/AMP-acid ligase II